jgi:hypothetical protein
MIKSNQTVGDWGGPTSDMYRTAASRYAADRNPYQ